MGVSIRRLMFVAMAISGAYVLYVFLVVLPSARAERDAAYERIFIRLVESLIVRDAAMEELGRKVEDAVFDATQAVKADGR